MLVIRSEQKPEFSSKSLPAFMICGPDIMCIFNWWALPFPWPPLLAESYCGIILQGSLLHGGAVCRHRASPAMRTAAL